MNKNTRHILIIVGSSAALLLAFLAGGLSYRAGLLSDIKAIFIQAPPPTEKHPDIQPDFGFEFLNNPQLAALNSQQLPDNQTPLKFVVAGHIYGKPGEKEFHPAHTLLTNIALLKRIAPDFIILLGDTVWKPSEDSFNNLELLILNQFDVPVFNAVGNHDVTKRELYQSRYGDTVYAFSYKNQLFFILDTTLNYYDLTLDQYLFINKTIRGQSPNLEAIHIFMHHVLFLEDDELNSKQLLKPNEGDGRSLEYWTYVEKELILVSETIPIYIYAGDVGAFNGGNLSPLFKKMSEQNIFFMATGLGGNSNDSILIVEADHEGYLKFQPYSLTGKQMHAIETYTINYWLDQ